MKESQFNMHRFLLVAKRDIMEDWKGNLTKGIGYYALYTIIMISLFINSHGMKFHDFIANMAEWILLFTSIVFIFVSSDVLSPLSSKAKRISFLNLPATNLEKFVWRFLYVSVGFLAINLAAIILLDITHYLLLPLFSLGEGYANLLTPYLIAEIYDRITSIYFNVDGTPIDISAISVTTLLVMSLWAHSLYLVGGCIWQKHPVLRTVSALFFLFVLMLIVLKMFSPVLLDIKPFMTEFFRNNGVKPFVIIVDCVIGAFTLLNWWISYRIFRNMQIVNPKLFKR